MLDAVIMDYQYELEIYCDKGEDHPDLLGGADSSPTNSFNRAEQRRRDAMMREREKIFEDANRIRKHWGLMLRHTGTLPMAKSRAPAYFNRKNHANRALVDQLPEQLREPGHPVLQGGLHLTDIMLEYVQSDVNMSNAEKRRFIEKFVAESHQMYVSVRVRGRFTSGIPMSWSKNNLTTLSVPLGASFAGRSLLMSDLYMTSAADAMIAGGTGGDDPHCDEKHISLVEKVDFDALSTKDAVASYLACSAADVRERLRNARNWETLRERRETMRKSAAARKQAQRDAQHRKTKAGLLLPAIDELRTSGAETLRAVGSRIDQVLFGTGGGGGALSKKAESSESSSRVEYLRTMCQELGSVTQFLDDVESAVGGPAAILARYGEIRVGGGRAGDSSTTAAKEHEDPEGEALTKKYKTEYYPELSDFLRKFGCLRDVVSTSGASGGAGATTTRAARHVEGTAAPVAGQAQAAPAAAEAPAAATADAAVVAWAPYLVDGKGHQGEHQGHVDAQRITDDDLAQYTEKAQAAVAPGPKKLCSCRL
ncbi:unnamed protein product, partial [Amoebophrya sp. A25]|eukprot:GSA25T00003493001.1